MEIMGLALIVILVGIGLLFAAQYSLKKPSKTVQTTKEKTLAVNFITVMLNTHTDCSEKQIKDFLQDCTLARQINCLGETNPCTYASEQIKRLLRGTLKDWKKNYDLVVAPEGQEDSPVAMKFSSAQTGKACARAEEVVSSGPFNYPVVSGYVLVITLNIC